MSMLLTTQVLHCHSQHMAELHLQHQASMAHTQAAYASQRQRLQEQHERQVVDLWPELLAAGLAILMTDKLSVVTTICWNG